MDYETWGNIQKGDRISYFMSSRKGIVISTIGIGKVIQWDNGKIERIQNNGYIDMVKSKQFEVEKEN